MDTNTKTRETAKREYACAAAAEWNRFDYDYSNLWRMFDKDALPTKHSGNKDLVKR